MEHRVRRLAAIVLATGLWAAAPILGAEPAAAQSAADIQWAQTILKEKGLYSGPMRGELNPQTKAALTAYQKSVGLKQTGALDQATIARMMSERESKTAPTMGNLAAPSQNANRPAPAARNAEAPKPLAAPTKGVESSGSSDGTAMIGSIERNAPMAGGPVAAPRGAVETVGGTGAAGAGNGGWFPNGIVAPEWVRTAVIGMLGATLALAAAIWWLSGRRPSKRRGKSAVAAAPDRRREPTFEFPAGSRDRMKGPPLRGRRI